MPTPLPGRAFPLNLVVFRQKKLISFQACLETSTSGLTQHPWKTNSTYPDASDDPCCQVASNRLPEQCQVQWPALKWLKGNSTKEHPQPLMPTSPMLPELARMPGKRKNNSSSGFAQGPANRFKHTFAMRQKFTTSRNSTKHLRVAKAWSKKHVGLVHMSAIYLALL